MKIDKKIKETNVTIKNVLQAYKKLEDGGSLELVCTYWERKETHFFGFSYSKSGQKYINFKHQVDCIKNDFKDTSTHYRGNKKYCKFKWVIK